MYVDILHPRVEVVYILGGAPDLSRQDRVMNEAQDDAVPAVVTRTTHRAGPCTDEVVNR